MLHGPEAYEFTARSAAALLARAARGDAPAGFRTPVTAYGRDLLPDLGAPGSSGACPSEPDAGDRARHDPVADPAASAGPSRAASATSSSTTARSTAASRETRTHDFPTEAPGSRSA